MGTGYWLVRDRGWDIKGMKMGVEREFEVDVEVAGWTARCLRRWCDDTCES